MMVFYWFDEHNASHIDFIQWLPDCICEQDRAYWAVPGTIR